MKVFAANNFRGYYIGGSAVVIAPSKERAVELLNKQFEVLGFKDRVFHIDVFQITQTREQVVILSDGDY